MRRWLALVAIGIGLLVAVADTAHAQPGAAPPTYAPPPPPPGAVTGPLPGEKSPGTALALSLGGTVASFALASIGGNAENDALATVGSIGVWFAPSFGHWYAGKGWTNGLTMRLAGAGVIVVGAVMLIGCIDSESSCDEDAGVAVLIGGAGLFVVGSVYDIATAPDSARAYNERLRVRASGGWAIAPVITHDRAGFAFTGHF